MSCCFSSCKPEWMSLTFWEMFWITFMSKVLLSQWVYLDFLSKAADWTKIGFWTNCDVTKSSHMVAAGECDNSPTTAAQAQQMLKSEQWVCRPWRDELCLAWESWNLTLSYLCDSHWSLSFWAADRYILYLPQWTTTATRSYMRSRLTASPDVLNRRSSRGKTTR